MRFKNMKSLKSTNYFNVVAMLILLFATGKAFSQENTILTFSEAINLAINSNQSLASQQSNLEVKELDVTIARANFLPSLHFSAAYLPSQGQKINDWHRLGVGTGTQGLLSASFSQMIYNEKFISEHKIQKDLYASQEEKYRSSKYQIISATGQAYINVIMAEQMLEIQNKNLDLTSLNLKASVDREEAGESSHQEVLRWQTQLYSDEQQVIGQEANIIVSRVDFNQLLNRPEEEVTILDNLIVERDGFIFSSPLIALAIEDKNNARIVRDYLVELGMSNYPDLVSMDYEIAATEQQLKSNQRWLIPSFSLVAGADELFLIKDDDAGDKELGGIDFMFLGASVSWSVFNGGSNFSKIKQSKIQVEALNAEKRELTSSLKQYIRSNAAITIGSYQKIAMAKAQNKTATENYNEVLDSYFVGESTLLDLLDAQEQKITSDITVSATMYSFFLNLIGLEQAIGRFPFMESQEVINKMISDLEARILKN
jgi:outer membrane protein